MAEAKENPIIFDDMIEVEALNPDGKKFDKVTRLQCRSETYEVNMLIDINSDLFPCRPHDKLMVALAKTLNLDGRPDTGVYNQTSEPTLLDDYDYGMHGTVFHYEHKKDQDVSVYISFCGLLCKMDGPQRHLSNIEQDQKLYLLMRRAKS